MSSNESIRLQLNEKEIRRSSRRETPLTSFAEQFKAGLNTGAGVISNMAATAGYSIPGAAVVSAAVTGAGAVRSANGNGIGASGLTGAYGSSVAGLGTAGMDVGAMGPTGGIMGAVAQQAMDGNPQAQVMMATQQMQEMNQVFNLQYLQLQERMQHEGRAFTSMSNVMKAKHDAARNTLSNLK